MTLKEINPILEEEQENTSLIDMDFVTPNISSISLEVDETIYGDFSRNSFIVVDTQEHKEDISSVYMESIIDLMKGLNTKIDALKNEKSEEKHILERVMSFLTIGDSRSAEETIQCYNNKNSSTLYEIYMNLVQKTLPQFFISVKEELLNTKEISLTLKNLFNETDTKLYKKLEENERLKRIINQQSEEHKYQLEELNKEKDYMKEEILKMINEFGGKIKGESQLEEDILINLKKIVKNKNEEIANLKEHLAKKEFILSEYQLKESTYDVICLNQKVDDSNRRQVKLQEENLNLTQVVNKMADKNTKLKQELIFFHSELKKAMEALAQKKETITRQKNLIELFQDKLSGSTFPIDELRRKKAEIERKLIKETDYFTKQELKKESEDCEKRLSDFLSLNRRF